MFAPLLLAAALAPPADVGDPAADPWAGRTGPAVTVENHDGRIRLDPDGPLSVAVRVDPFVPAPVYMTLLRETPDGDGDGERELRTVIGAEAFPIQPPAGSAGPFDDPDRPVRDPAGRPGFAVFRLSPPAGGWPTGRGELRVALDGFGGAAVVLPVRTVRRLDPEALVGWLLGLKPPPGPFDDLPATRPDRGFVLDVNAAAEAARDAGGENAAGDDEPAATLRPWERFAVRGTFRAPAPPPGVGYGPGVSVRFAWDRGFAFAGTTRSFPAAGPDGEPDADGAVLYWFRLPTELPGGAGRYTMEVETGDGPADWRRSAPLTILAEEEGEPDGGE